MTIRAERRDDAPDIRRIHCTAFGTAAEADLVEALRRRATPFLSLVADDLGLVVGQITFSPATLTSDPDLSMLGLAPMAVLPDRQRRGIGSALVRAGLDACARVGAAAVIVLGHGEYYPRFGFVPGSRYRIRCEYDVPDEAFMVLELRPGSLRQPGTACYHPAFAELS